MIELPPIVARYLEVRGLAVVSSDELDALRQRPEHSCPFPLFPWKFGLTHDEYLGTILDTEEALTGLNVVRCTACGHVSFREPVALA